MPEGLKLEELEAYRDEARNAEREGRPNKYRNPREVFAEDPNLDSYLVEKDEETLQTEQDVIDRQNDGAVTPSNYLADPGQEVAEAAALASSATESTHQNTQSTPNPVNETQDGTVEEGTEVPEGAGLTDGSELTEGQKRDSALTGPDIDSPNHPTPYGSNTTEGLGDVNTPTVNDPTQPEDQTQPTPPNDGRELQPDQQGDTLPVNPEQSARPDLDSI